MHYIKNLETDKINIISSKEEYQALPFEKRDFIRRNCSFNGKMWVSKAKINNAWFLLAKLKEWNIECEGEQGTKPSFAEKVAISLEKAAIRADKMETRLNKWEKRSNEHYNVAKRIGSFIPMGQPILIGHHSERRHRRDLEKIDSNMRQSCEASEKATYYANRLDASTKTAEGKKYRDIAYLGNRIKECEAKINEYKRGLKGKIYYYSEPKKISDEETNYWNKKIAEKQEELDFYNYCLQQCVDNGAKLFTKETLKDKKEVLIKGRWEKIVKLNNTTIAIPNSCFPEEIHQIKYALKYKYTEIKDAR